MNRKKLVILSLFIVSILLSRDILISYAVPYYDDASLDSDVVVFHPQKTQVTHSATGKLVYCYWDPSDEDIYAIIYSADGTNEALSTRSQDYQSYCRLIVSDFGHATDVFIVAQSRINVQHVELRLYRLNVNTYSWSYLGEEHASTEQETYRFGISEGFEYNSDYYWFFHRWDFDDTTGGFGFIELDPATDVWSVTLNETISETSAYNPQNGHPPVMVVQDPTYSQLFYMLTADQDDDTRPTFYRFDVTGGASDIVKLGTAGNADRLQEVGLFQWSQTFIGGGVEDSGDLRYLYYTYAYGYHLPDNNRAYWLTQHRLIFNVSGTGSILSANLTAQNVRSASMGPNLGATATYVTWIVGYLESRDVIQVYSSNWNSQDGYIVQNSLITLDSWLSYTTTPLTITSDTTEDYGENIYEPRNMAHSHISRDWDSTFQTDYSDPSDDLWRIWYDLEVVDVTYDITLSYLPADAPLQTNTNYQFTAQSTMNNLGTEVINVVYWDGSQIATDYSEANGVYEFTLLSSVGGLHNLTISIWDDTPPVYKYSESWTYTFSYPDPTENPTTPNLITMTTTLFVYAIPTLILSIVPMFLFYRMLDESMLGALFGLSLGLILSAIAGYIPTYTIYLMLLIDIAIVVKELS